MSIIISYQTTKHLTVIKMDMTPVKRFSPLTITSPEEEPSKVKSDIYI